MHLVAAILRLQIAAHLLDKIRRERVGIVLRIQLQGLRLCRRRLCRRNLPIFEQRVEDKVAALEGLVGVIDRRIYRRALRQACEQRGFFERQVLGWLAEVVFGRGLEAIYAMPEKNLVGIKRKDLWLGEAALDLNSQQSFLDFAME